METNNIIDSAVMELAPGTDAWELVNCETRANDLATAVAAAAGATVGIDEFEPSTSPPQLGQCPEDLMKRSVLREELRVNILQRRWQKGLGSVRVDWKLGKTDKLTPEEMDKRRVRRERNRVAASRCRERRREKTFVLVQETDQLEDSNHELMNEIQQLETERQELLSFLQSHNQTCGLSLPVLAPGMQELHIDPE